MMILSLFASAPAGAQELGGFGLGAWGGGLELGYVADRQRSSTQGGTASDSRYRRYNERLTLSNQGFYYLDPRLVTGNLALTFGLYQDHAQSDGTPTSRRGTLNGYAFDTTIVPDKPYNAKLYANRTRNFVNQPFGGRTESSFENRGVVLRLREDSFLREQGIPYFSSALRFYEERYEESTTSLGQSLQRDERRNGVRFDSHKGFETSDLDLEYEFIDHQYPAGTQTGLETTMGRLVYSLDFGPTLNRRWDSRLSYSDRSGLSPVRLVTADEQLRIDHYKHLSTDYRYLLTRIDTQAGTTTTHNGIFHLRHRLYRNLTTDARLSALRRDLPAGQQSSYAGQLGFGYRRGLPRDGRMFASANWSYQLSDNQLTASRIDVVDASYSAPSPLGGGAGFLLADSFVDSASIVVVDTRGGARLATTVGVDYDLVPEGNLIRIVPLPTSLVIQAGDPLAVSYTYVVDPSLKYSTASSSLRTGADFRWIAFSVAHQQTDQTRRSGNPGQFLEDRRTDTADLQLRGNWKATRGEAGAAYERYDATFLAYSRQRLHQLVTYRPRNTFTLTISAEQTHTDYTLPARQSDNRSLQLTTSWLAPGAWWTTALIGRRTYSDSLSPGETVDEAKLQARKTYGKASVNTGLAYSDRARDYSRAKFWHFDVTLTRRF